MEDLVYRIRMAVEAIDMLSALLISGAMVSKDELLQTSASAILPVFPDIVDTYEMDELKGKADEVSCWGDQLERLISALEGEDAFYMIDVLKYETKENLLLFIATITEAGLI